MELNKRIIKNLEEIKHRYFRPTGRNPEGDLVHYGDCEIYRSTEIYGIAYCNCGFNYAVESSGLSNALMLNPELMNESILDNPHRSSKTEQLQIKKLFEDCFGEFPRAFKNLTTSNEEWEYIEQVFGIKYTDFLKSIMHDTECQNCLISFSSKKHKICPKCAA